MNHFIPFEDDWAMAEALASHRLVPYQPGMRRPAEDGHGGIPDPFPADAAVQDERNSHAPSSQSLLAAL